MSSSAALSPQEPPTLVPLAAQRQFPLHPSQGDLALGLRPRSSKAERRHRTVHSRSCSPKTRSSSKRPASTRSRRQQSRLASSCCPRAAVELHGDVAPPPHLPVHGAEGEPRLPHCCTGDKLCSRSTHGAQSEDASHDKPAPTRRVKSASLASRRSPDRVASLKSALHMSTTGSSTVHHPASGDLQQPQVLPGDCQYSSR